MYGIVVGEMGISRHEFLYTLKLWEIVAIRKAYEKRIARAWETARFMAYCTVKSSMRGAPKVRNLYEFFPLPSDPKDDDDVELPNDAEIERLQREMRKFNAENNITG